MERENERQSHTSNKNTKPPGGFALYRERKFMSLDFDATLIQVRVECGECSGTTVSAHILLIIAQQAININA